VIDNHYSDAILAGLYDPFNRPERRADFGFYLPLVMAADAVLDVGCGTGALLRLARDAGHRGRLCGLDPAVAMLDRARQRPDVEWVLGDLTSVAWDREFDLVVMTGHAFQVLLGDDELLEALGRIRAALREDGRFAFETRNPLVRAWERWTADRVAEVRDGSGELVRAWAQVEGPIEGDVVRFTLNYASRAWEGPRTSTSTLRFLDAVSLASFLSRASLAIEQQFGDWSGEPLTDASPEIITVARKR
jgi:SAM-dependent methyltransferase